MTKYLCTRDGGQHNVPVEVEHHQYGLNLVRGLTSDLVGWVGTDGHCYTLAHDNELYDVEQLDPPESRSNVVQFK